MKEAIGYALAPKLLVDNKLKVRFMYREEPDDASDSGWRFSAVMKAMNTLIIQKILDYIA